MMLSEEFKCFQKSINITNKEKYLCDICGINYYLLDNNLYEHTLQINCFDNLNLSNSSCYLSCKTCALPGNSSNHNCLTCQDDYIYELNISNYKN